MNTADIFFYYDGWSNGPAPKSKDAIAQTQPRKRKKRESIAKLGNGLLH